MPQSALLQRSTPTTEGISSSAIAAVIDRLEEKGIEPHSLMIVRNGRIAAEGWWAPYSAERPQLLYSVTKSFTSIAVGLAIADGALSLDSLVIDVLPDHVPLDIADQGRRIAVHHLLTMTSGHGIDTLGEAWRLEPHDLVKGFLRLPFATAEGTHHVYDNATTFILARMVERATGRSLPDFLAERLFTPMGIDHAEWDRVGSGAAFGFHGLHLTTEAVAAFGELLLRGGLWGDKQLIPREWVEEATRSHIASQHCIEGEFGEDFLSGYGYQFWTARHGFHANGAYGQHCVVVPSRDLVVVVTSAQYTGQQAQDVLDAIWECLLPGIDAPGLNHLDRSTDDHELAQRMRNLALSVVSGTAGPQHPVTATIDASPDNSALPDATAVTIAPADGGWIVQCESLGDIAIGYGSWHESAPLGRSLCSNGAWNADVFSADLYVISTPHHLKLTVDARTGIAIIIWDTVPLTTPDLALHLRHPLMTRPDVS